MNLHERTILITGATSGIGRALAVKLAKRGNTVLAVGRAPDKLAELAATPGIKTFACNLAAKGEVIALGHEIEKRDLPVSVLINCAAVQFTPKFTDADFSFNGIETEIATNFTAVAWLSALLLPRLMTHDGGAAIVNLTSGLAIYPKTSSALYSATKAAVHSLSQTLRYQLADTPVQVTEILLPLVDTPMTEGRGTDKITPSHAAEETIRAVEKGKDELYVGKAGLIPVLNRLSPALTKRILKNA